MRTICIVPDLSCAPERLASVLHRKEMHMAFLEATRLQIFKNANGKCEKCAKQLVYANHIHGERGAWQAHHKTSVAADGNDTASNGKALCLDCHKNTYTFGGK